ncbi:N-acetyldiaminopimelate deacetylase [Oceanobacillus sp. J11TS1]|uniref:N-acetyldiaminopimelate deacetylase n=1 Tax=Oceanobacillus sp. J11TS1 TaxID=2807191 RepID=UPI001B04E487|nr:N-acetyldiaminopimelate deacetylase [Oceanobacillus sp. J11TS1]GIO22364.1 N-acetyldiaminopimelate deacetylase [Oceanobacillus sp. J11TS1]
MTAFDLQRVRRDLHRIPELGFQEEKTQQYLLTKIQEMATDRVQVKTWRTGILVHIDGTSPTKRIGFRTDIDGLPILEDTGFDFSSTHVGKMHACGHDFHMTIALAALQRIIDRPVKDNVLFVFQPAEEGPGGAKPMIESKEFLDWKPDTIFALHIAPELPVGQVSSKPGLLFANTSELFIDFKGLGGHAAYPHLAKDMTVAASNFVVQLQQIVSRGLNPLDGSVITIGKMESGFVQNAIAETARLEGTIRTTEASSISIVKEKLEKLIKGFEIAYECKINVDYGSNYYQVVNAEKYVEQFKECLSSTDVEYIQASPAMTGEDFGDMLKIIPGFMFWLGVDSPYGLHHAKLAPKEEALAIGVEAVETFIRSFG